MAMIKHTPRLILSLLLLLTIRLSQSISISTENWWCGTSHTDATTSCTQPCPTGSGCPFGTVCFSGITTCSSTSRYCGTSLSDANTKCGTPCPNGSGCPTGEACWFDTTCDGGSSSSGSESSSNNNGAGGILSFLSNENSQSSSSSSSTSFLSNSNSLGGLTGTAAIEQTFLQMKEAINTKLFLYETPMMQWLPSTVYRFEGFFDGLKIMHSQGVAGKKIYLGGDCKHCHMYGLINVAAFLAQAMKETIRYDACDENSWDRVGDDLMYPISNACGQLGQSYQDYHCSEEDKHMECEVDPAMTITAVTNAKWWGAPGPLKCGPKSLYPQTGHWDFQYECDNIWATPPETCDAYDGQKGGKAMNDAPYPNAAGRTDVEGCCWWGRGVIQTSGVCNFGKLNYFLGKRAADEGRESRYPSIDFCKDPEAICSSKEHQELKWIAGFFYWVQDVQLYDREGWNYIAELHKFVDSGMEGDAFINSVSGIVNRGCHNPPCPPNGALDGGPERAKNFQDIMKEMKFSFVEVDPQHVSSPVPPPVVVKPATPSSGGASEVRYSCGDGYEFDSSDTSIPPSSEVAFDYEIHNGIEVTVGDALREIKESILSDVAGAMGCYKTDSGRELQDSSGAYDSIIGLQSNANDLPDPDTSGCMVDVKTDNPATCTPVSGGFTIHAKPGTSESSLQNTVRSLKAIVKTGMVTGTYETKTVVKAIYIGDRDKFSKASAPINAVQSEGTNESSDDVLKIVVYALASLCLILICVLWFAIWTYRERLQNKRHKNDEEMAFGSFMNVNEESRHNSHHDMMMAPQVNDYMYMRPEQSQPVPRQISQNRSNRFDDDRGEEFPQQRPRSLSRGKSSDRFDITAPSFMNSKPEFENTTSVSETTSGEEEMELGAPTMPQQRMPAQKRSHSVPRSQSNAHQTFHESSSTRKAMSEGDSVSSSSSSGGSSEYSRSSESEDETFNDSEQKFPVASSPPRRPPPPPPPKPSRSPGRVPPSNNINMNNYNRRHSQPIGRPSRSNDSDNISMNNYSRRHSQPIGVPQNDPSSAREARQQRMAAARARASKRNALT